MARPSIITDALIAEFCSKVRLSGSIETAILACGLSIGREKYSDWARAVHNGGGTSRQKQFIGAVDKAVGEVKLVREAALQKQGEKKWRCAAWLLERKHSHEYGQRRPPPLADPDTAAEERKVDRLVWKESECLEPASAPAEVPAAAADKTPTALSDE